MMMTPDDTKKILELLRETIRTIDGISSPKKAETRLRDDLMVILRKYENKKDKQENTKSKAKTE
jgi:hypothetical protein